MDKPCAHGSAASEPDTLSSAGRALLAVHLVLSATLFSPTTVEVFEFNKIALLTLTAILLATGAGLAAIRNGAHLSLRRDPVGLGVAAFVLSALLSTVFSWSPRMSWEGAHESFSGLRTILSYAVLFFATRALCRTPADAWALLAAPVLGATLAAGYAVLQVARLDPIHWQGTSPLAGYVRPFGTLGHPNQLAVYLVMALPLVGAFAWRAWQQGRRGACATLGLTAALLAFVIMATVSRGAWLALAAAALVGAAPWFRVRRRLITAGGVVLLLTVGLVGMAALGGSGQGLVNSVLERGRHLGDATSRRCIWEAALAIWRDQPLLGCGLDTFAIAFPAHRTPEYWGVEWNGTPTKAHNELLQVLATQGLVGAATALALIAALAWTAWRAARGATATRRALVLALSAGIVGCCVQNLTSFATAGCATLLVTFAALLSRWASEPESGEGSAVPSPAAPGPVYLAGLIAFLLFVHEAGGVGLLTDAHFAGGLLALAAALVVVTRSVVSPGTGEADAAWRDWLVSARPTLRWIPSVGVVACGGLLVIVGVVRPVLANRACQASAAHLPNDPAAAVVELERAVALDPDCEMYWTRLGDAYRFTAVQQTAPAERYTLRCKARAAFERAIELVPVNGYLHCNRARLLAELVPEKMATPADVYAAFDAALARDGTNAYFYLYATHTARTFGDAPRAKRYLARGIELYPRFGPLRTQEAYLAMAEGRIDDAEAMYPEAEYLDWHDDGRAYLNLLAVMAWARLQHNCPLDAWYVSTHVIQQLPDWPLPRLTQAQALEKLGRLDEAREAYRQFLALSPGYGPAQESLRRLENGAPVVQPMPRAVQPAEN